VVDVLGSLSPEPHAPRASTATATATVVTAAHDRAARDGFGI
jgi:hypothetical protein